MFLKEFILFKKCIIKLYQEKVNSRLYKQIEFFFWFNIFHWDDKLLLEFDKFIFDKF